MDRKFISLHPAKQKGQTTRDAEQTRAEMPESILYSTQENGISLEAMDISMDDREAADPASEGIVESRLNMSRDSAKSVESLNTLLMSMPEISIPPPVHNPLPLQCLAASALPVELKREIDVVIAECALSALSSDEDQEQVQRERPASLLSADIACASGILEDMKFASTEQVSGILVYCCLPIIYQLCA